VFCCLWQLRHRRIRSVYTLHLTRLMLYQHTRRNTTLYYERKTRRPLFKWLPITEYMLPTKIIQRKNRQEVKVIWQKAPHGGPAHSPVRGYPRGSKFVPLNSWGRGFLLAFHSNYRPRMYRLATVHARDNQPTTNDVTTQPISISASFTNVKWGA